MVDAPAIPSKAALRRGVRVVHPELEEVTVVCVGAHGFSVLEVSHSGDWFQQNSRCSQGTGNFLAQLVERFGLTVEEASALVHTVPNPAPLSGRCPVILKTDMTHLANKGEDRARILAGLYDAVCENVLTLVRPRLAPRNVVLTGGVARSGRIRRNVAHWLSERGLRLVAAKPDDEFLEAIGAASHALDHPSPVPRPERLLVVGRGADIERVPSLGSYLDNVERRSPVDLSRPLSSARDVFLGFDIGSTGSKVVAIDAVTAEAVWETYLNTEGAPVGAAQRLLHRWTIASASFGHVVGFGITGSGREVVGSLFRTCYGEDRVYVMNEIAAHARGATSFDPDVDTIFEIGGQDAKYIRLEEGRVIDAAMNEACSAGTGSFIAEQGTKFDESTPQALGKLAMTAGFGISLGQHCSVFMAEVIDEAIAQAVPRESIVAGLYDSVIQNYLNRVKGPRTVGNKIFCQGMPFSSDALAAAVARQTGRRVVIPPNPGTIGALGIALLTQSSPVGALRAPLDPAVFLGARVQSKENFVCKSVKGCGGSGNHCRIDRLTTVVSGHAQKFLWGGNCSLYDRGGTRAKLPDLAPDPFREREALLDVLVESARGTGGPVVAMTDEFALKGIAPLFVVFLRELGLDVRVQRHAGGESLRRGIESARIPFCAPMQLYHGVFFELVDTKPDYVLLPMLQELPRVADEEHACLCPVVQASPDILKGVLQPENAPKLLNPVIQFDQEGYDSVRFREALKDLAIEVGAEQRFEHAFAQAVRMQRTFEQDCLDIGQRALEFCAIQRVVPVAVLGRPYTLYNDVLNSNVPTILRSLGAMPIPLDCLPVPDGMPLYRDQYWAYTQRNLRAAEWVRRTPGVYSVFCSNYACGPDSFTLHFYAYLMRGKPFAVVETDGHSGDAGTKTRMEAFLFCVDTDLVSRASEQGLTTDLRAIEDDKMPMRDIRDQGALMLIPRMGPQSVVAAAALRAEGFQAEALEMSNRQDVRMGRRYTSGKECVPMMLTLGTFLNRIERERETTQPITLVMPTASGPCRFGVYNTLFKVVLKDLDWGDRVRVFSPDDSDYFRECSPAFSVRSWVGFCVHDLLEAMLHDVRPLETTPGAADAIYERAVGRLVNALEVRGRGTVRDAIFQLLGSMWGMKAIVADTALEMAEVKRHDREIPTVAVVGEIYVRLDAFANDGLVRKLEARGLRVRFAPFVEWLEYTTFLAMERVLDGRANDSDNPASIGLTHIVQQASLGHLYDLCAKPLGWGERSKVAHAVEAAKPYVARSLAGETVLTVGGPVHEFHEKMIHGVVVVGPHECMPCKIAEAQLGKVAEDVQLPYLVLAVNGDPLDPEPLDRFAYDIQDAFQKGKGRAWREVAPALDPSYLRADGDRVALRKGANGVELRSTPSAE
ncbi:MAG: BadF/BadG/BcrA/BcrD ATPase family protein [Myxococcales bacterium]